MTSNALFINVAELIVISAPIFHVGCLNASSRALSHEKSSTCPLKNIPPLAVIQIFLIAFASPLQAV